MDTIVYLIRHSEKLDTKYIDKYHSDGFYQITREKRILSSEGERKAKILSENEEFDKLDIIIQVIMLELFKQQNILQKD